MNGIDSKRRYGVLLHPTAFSSKWGVGDIGISSRRFLSWLKAAGAKMWQLLPIGVVDKWGCPYSSLSAFGGNPMLICLEDLVEMNLLLPTQLTTSPSEYDKVNFNKAWTKKKILLLQSFANFKADRKNEDSFNLFLQKEGHWVHDLADFLVLTETYGDDWTDWPSGLKTREVDAIEKFEEAHEDEISFEIYLQYLFDLQWKKLKEAANDDGIELFGDIPIFVAHHSMDVWRHPERFKLNSEGKMSVETGAPPDAFSETGQKWGTPNYNWEVMKSLDFEWWVDRMKYMVERFDIIRLDHFLGFVHIWESPKDDSDARGGGWTSTPGRELFQTIREKLGKLPFIAEDLGKVDEDVHKLRNDFELPGMKILQFAFGTDETNEHLPENTPSHFVVYTGTHDNNTLMGWYEERLTAKAAKELKTMYEVLSKYSDRSQINERFIETAMKENSFLCIFPVQDILGQGEEARFNTPGTTGDNWNWILPEGLLTTDKASDMRSLAEETGRL